MSDPQQRPDPRPASPFDPDLTPGNLKRRSVRGGVWMVATQAAAHTVRLAVMLALARILTPDDFGLLAMIMSTIGIAGVFRDMGLSVATVQRKDLTAEQVSTMFWLNAGFGALIAVVCVLCAPLLVMFYSDSRALHVTMAVSLGFLFSGLATQHQALLRRRLQFLELAKLNVMSAACAATAALALALQGAAYWALVASALVGDFVTLVLAWHYSRWRPARPRFDRSTLEMMSFGGYLVAFGFLGFLARNLHNLLLGRYFGTTAAGLFNRAYALMLTLQNYSTNATQMVALPSLSRLDPRSAAYRSYYLTNVRVVSMAASAPACVAALFSADVIRVLFGDQWGPSADVLRWLAVGLLIQPILHSSGLLFLSNGRSRDMMLWGIFGWTLMMICLAGGLRFGLEGMAIGHAASFYLLVVPCMVYAIRGTSVTLGDAFAAWLPGAAAGVTAALPAWALAQLLQHWSALARLFVAGATFSVLYAALLFTAFGQRALILDILRQFRRTAQA